MFCYRPSSYTATCRRIDDRLAGATASLGLTWVPFDRGSPVVASCPVISTNTVHSASSVIPAICVLDATALSQDSVDTARRRARAQ